MSAAPSLKKKKPEHPSVNPDSRRCSYYVVRKHRFCRTECRAGALYCSTHLSDASLSTGASAISSATTAAGALTRPAEAAPSGETVAVDPRIPCPINPNHTVFASRMARHVKVCPDLRFVASRLPYFCLDKHAAKGCCFLSSTALPLEAIQPRTAEAEGNPTGSTPPPAGRQTHRDLTEAELTALIEKVNACFDEWIAPDLVQLNISLPTDRDGGAAAAEAPAEQTSHGFRHDAVPAAPPQSAAPSPPVPRSTSSVKHGHQHEALLQCVNDVVLQSLEDSSILSSRLRRGGNEAEKDTALHPSQHLNQHQNRPIRVAGFLELGAGKGGLSVALQQAILRDRPAEGQQGVGQGTATYAGDPSDGRDDQSSNPQHHHGGISATSQGLRWPFVAHVAQRPSLVVIDVGGFRRVGDATVRHSPLPLQRLRINLKDLNLTRAFLTTIHSPVQQKAALSSLEHWAVLGKHLCGSCTDFGLSCLEEASTLKEEAGVQLSVVVLATCCHHRCELLHLNPPSTMTMPPASGEADEPLDSPGSNSCDSSRHRRHRSDCGGETEGAPLRPLVLPGSSVAWSAEEFAALSSMSSWAVCGDFVDEHRRQIGWRCKRIIDQFRVAYLRRLGYTAFQCTYASRAITEENVCLVAYRC